MCAAERRRYVEVHDDESGPTDPVGRRRFLQWVSAMGSGLTAALVGFPTFKALLSPALQPPKAAPWIKVADDIAVIDLEVPVRLDFVREVQDAWVESRMLNSVWVYTEDGEHFRAWSGRCTHLGCSFGYNAEKKVFECPCHRGVFDAKTGEVLGGPPPRALDELPVEVRDSAVWIQHREFRLGVKERVEV